LAKSYELLERMASRRMDAKLQVPHGAAADAGTASEFQPGHFQRAGANPDDSAGQRRRALGALQCALPPMEVAERMTGQAIAVLAKIVLHGLLSQLRSRGALG